MNTLKNSVTVIVFSLLVLSGVILFVHFTHGKSASAPPVTVIRAAEPDKREQKIQAAMWDVAKVFGRVQGCSEASPELGRYVAEAAVNHNIPPKRLASVVSVESKCNPFATSSRGAIGLGQVMPSIWKGSFDFQGKVNLLNEKDNLDVTATILGSYIKDYGEDQGITHYQGLATGCVTCDDQYTSKVIRLADGK